MTQIFMFRSASHSQAISFIYANTPKSKKKEIQNLKHFAFHAFRVRDTQAPNLFSHRFLYPSFSIFLDFKNKASISSICIWQGKQKKRQISNSRGIKMSTVSNAVR